VSLTTALKRKLTGHADPSLSVQANTENPYLNARREWNERYGEYIARERAWRSIAFFLGTIALFAVLGMVWSSSQNKLVPYVVQVDKFGDAVAARRADRAMPPDIRVLRAQLARWITEIRSVYLDAAAERIAILDVYAMLDHGAAAYGMLNDYMRDDAHNPFKRAEFETVAVEMQSVLPLTDASWRLEWVETVRDREGHETGHATWTATVSVSVHTPTDEKTLLLNPTGLSIQSVNWSQRF
jgi:type IV secretion system protein VirB5